MLLALSRDEVAEPAGVRVDYVTRLEQNGS
jgi:hypothetical protein